MLYPAELRAHAVNKAYQKRVGMSGVVYFWLCCIFLAPQLRGLALVTPLDVILGRVRAHAEHECRILIADAPAAIYQFQRDQPELSFIWSFAESYKADEMEREREHQER